MIPDLPDVVAAHDFLVRRYALSSRGDELVFFGALCEAGELAKEPADEPAAIFFAFARRAAKLGDAWSTLPDLLAFHQTSAVGYRLSAESTQLAALRRIGLVTPRREGTSVFYRVEDERVFELLAVSRDILSRQLETQQSLLRELEAE